MAKAKRARLARGKARAASRPSGIAEPTAEQFARGEWERAVVAYKRVPVIDTMLRRGQLNDDQHRRLTHYRDQAALADRSLTKSCLDIRVAGAAVTVGVPAAVLSAQLALARIERDLGARMALARAVAVDDVSLTEWCVAKFGGRERYDGKGTFIGMEPEGERKHGHIKVALLELRYAAGCIVA